ncbi:MAG: Unknown protein [uncultured Sulfurovum sp.]|uniref:Uncharacterized protein n=1 Tax=uncultured Sulfurovum sp. TaxID=269237 RepID=A0A6S6UG97_9BACT|nr:MAG: Unknown protein [uncultured Sulfurovum sp.]
MKNFRKTTIATLALIALSQTISANYTINNFETLDVTKFSSVWQELNKNNKRDQAHLSSYMNKLLDNSQKVAYEECTPSIDVNRFSSLWQEVKVNNNNAVHLSTAFNSTATEVICTVS